LTRKANEGGETRIMEPSNPVPPQVRLKELLAVPDRDRTEEEWDELIELEISLAPENRIKRGGNRNDGGGGNQGGGGNRRGNKKSGRKRPNRDKTPRPERAS
tara:strand:- start:249 stop:554 length:306 start_codon:yes stop_codon:yes gene_type:complete